MKKGDLNYAVLMFRALTGARGYKDTSIKVKLFEARVKVSKAYKDETSSVFELLDEKRDVVIDHIKGQVDDFLKQLEKSGEKSEKSKEEIQEGIIADDQDLLDIRKEKNKVQDEPVSKKPTALHLPGLEPVDEEVSVVLDNGNTGIVNTKDAYNFLVKKGFIVVEDIFKQTIEEDEQNSDSGDAAGSDSADTDNKILGRRKAAKQGD